ncbi:hypothetical protein Syun_006079 [Stephania yunnanensis]|uniref:6-phosphogluconate dehydrogenase NADP-binding domain-containing protein n=1 Tax=Stephania yunnanensis TaxID=152371 RepID=A0AAP0KXD3_9MAGN
MGQSTCSHLIYVGFSHTIFTSTHYKAQPLINLGAHFAPSHAALAAQCKVVFSIVNYPSNVHLHPFTDLSTPLPQRRLVDMTTCDQKEEFDEEKEHDGMVLSGWIQARDERMVNVRDYEWESTSNLTSPEIAERDHQWPDVWLSQGIENKVVRLTHATSQRFSASRNNLNR